MDLHEVSVDTLDNTRQSLQLRLELIEQMQAEYAEDMQGLQIRIQELMERFVYNGGPYWAESNPLLCQVIAELNEEIDFSDEESSDVDDTEEDELGAEAEGNNGEAGRREMELHEDSDADSRVLEIVTDEEPEDEEVEEEGAGAGDKRNTEEREECKGLNENDDDDDLQYPRRVQLDALSPPSVVLGPNGTTVDGCAFDRICWATTAAATRSLLTLVFSDEVLASHTLTGKPSPAFHGRERPPKMQLDARKTADIVHCVVSRCRGANERQVRSSITSKCADTAKKFKRRDSRGARHEN